MILTMDEVFKLGRLGMEMVVDVDATAKYPEEMLKHLHEQMFRRLEAMAQPMVVADIQRRDVVTTLTDERHVPGGGVRLEMRWAPPTKPAVVSLLGGPDDGTLLQIPDLWRGLTCAIRMPLGDLIRSGRPAEPIVPDQVHYEPYGWNNDEGHWVLTPGGKPL